MNIKCIKCETEEILTEEDTKLLGHIVRRYNPKPKPNDYIMVLNIIKGDCTDGKKHIYIFDESFDRTIAGLIKEHTELHVTNDARHKAVLEQMLDYAKTRKKEVPKREGWLEELKKIKERHQARLRESANRVRVRQPLHVHFLCQEIADFLDDNAMVILDSAVGSSYLTDRIQASFAGQVLDSGMEDQPPGQSGRGLVADGIRAYGGGQFRGRSKSTSDAGHWRTATHHLASHGVRRRTHFQPPISRPARRVH